MAKDKLKVIKVNILGQDYFIKTTANPKYFKEVSKYVNIRMKEVINSGIDSSTQQLKIAVLTCMNITDELLSYKTENTKVLDQIEAKSTSIIDYIDEKIENDSK